MAKIPSQAKYLYTEMVSIYAQMSEYFHQTIGGTINYLLDVLSGVDEATTSSGSSNQSTSASNWVTITNQTVTVDFPSDRPVVIECFADSSTSFPNTFRFSSGDNTRPLVRVFMDGTTELARWIIRFGTITVPAINQGSGMVKVILPAGTISVGEHTFQLQFTATDNIALDGVSIRMEIYTV